MPECAHVIAGRCTTTFEGARTSRQYGDVLVVVKPDRTVLVHDADGYQPVAWLTRPESVTVGADVVTARDGDQVLDVTVHDTRARAQYSVSEAGVPVGDCPDCGSTLVRARGSVSCPDCGEYPLPSGGAVLETSCECGLPQIRVERGEVFECCLDPDCGPLDELVRGTFDREWDCPDCGGDLRVLRRGGLLLGCENYPDCDTGYAFPDGVHDGACGCGLPVFETATGRRCLDTTCEEPGATRSVDG
jgi:DNA topoisomerase-1